MKNAIYYPEVDAGRALLVLKENADGTVDLGTADADGKNPVLEIGKCPVCETAKPGCCVAGKAADGVVARQAEEKKAAAKAVEDAEAAEAKNVANATKAASHPHTHTNR